MQQKNSVPVKKSALWGMLSALAVWLPVLLAFGGFIFMRKVMDWDAKGESDGDEYGEHHDHLPDAAGTVHTGRRA